jgi:V/A-type H+-transporting ATPase subunit F
MDMKKISFITPPDAEYGFSLSGITQHVVEVPDVEETLKQTIAEPDNGLVILDERLLKGISEERLRDIEQVWHGILLILPSPVKPPPEVEDYAARIIRRAIGYHVRLNV